MIQPRAEGSDNLIYARTKPEIEGVGSLPALLVHHEFHAAGEVGRKQAQGERHLAGWDAFWSRELRGRSQETIACNRESLDAAICANKVARVDA